MGDSQAPNSNQCAQARASKLSQWLAKCRILASTVQLKRDAPPTPCSKSWLTLEGEPKSLFAVKWGFQPLNHVKQKCKMFPNNNHEIVRSPLLTCPTDLDMAKKNR